MFFDFLFYYFKAKNAHGIHSPFVFELYTKVYKDFGQELAFKPIENRRNELRKDSRLIEINDFGAGSKVNSSNIRSVADISSKSLKSSFWSQFLYRLIKHYNYSTILELGTSLGITTSYLASANLDAKVLTLEGCENTLNIAKENFEVLSLSNIKTVPGDIDLTLVQTLKDIEHLDFVLFDANHRLEPTLRYFNACLEKTHQESCLVFDDIYWSTEMKEAWNEIKKDPRVSISIDFFHMGLVFFRPGVEKQHFVLR